MAPKHPTYYQRGLMVNAAENAGHGLTVETNEGSDYLFPVELREAWDALAPGEAFTITPCAACQDGQPQAHSYEPARQEVAA